MSLREVRRLNKNKSVGVIKHHWKNKHPIGTTTAFSRQEIAILLSRGTHGCWFTPLKRWVSLLWLDMNNYKSIADRIRNLNQVHEGRKHFVVFNTPRDTLMLSHIDTRILLELS